MRNKLIIALFFLSLGGCGSEPEKPEPVEPPPTFIQAKITVSPEVNPDVDGRPSPIVMRLFELKNLGKFVDADFYTLFDNYEAFLGSDLLASNLYHLKPGDTKIVKHAVAPETKFIALAAAYRDLNQAVWRASIPIKIARTTRLEIILNRLSATIRKQ